MSWTWFQIQMAALFYRKSHRYSKCTNAITLSVCMIKISLRNQIICMKMMVVYVSESFKTLNVFGLEFFLVTFSLTMLCFGLAHREVTHHYTSP